MGHIVSFLRSLLLCLLTALTPLSPALFYFLPRGTTVVLWIKLQLCPHVIIPATSVEPGFLAMLGPVTITPSALRPLRLSLPATPTLAHTLLPYAHVVKRKGSCALCSPPRLSNQVVRFLTASSGKELSSKRWFQFRKVHKHIELCSHNQVSCRPSVPSQIVPAITRGILSMLVHTF